MRLSAEALVANVLRLLPRAQAVYVFGSVSSATDRPESDVDVAVLLPRAVGSMERFELQEALAFELGRDVDLIDLRAAQTAFAAEIIEQGRLVHEADAVARSTFEMITLADYADLVERRRGIVEDALARGRIHG